MIRRSLVLVALAATLAAGCTSKEAGPSPEPPAPQTTAGTTEAVVTTAPSPGPAPFALPTSLVRFSEYAPVPLLEPDAPPYAGPATPHSLDGVQVAAEVEQALGEAGASDALAERGFVVVPADFRLFHFAYQGNVYEGWPVLVTTDAAYHVWHLVFDKVLRSLEQEVLLPRLEALVTGLVEAGAAQSAELAGTPVEEAASRAEQLFQVAAAELGLPVMLGPLAAQEKMLVDAHGGQETSPIAGAPIDYSLFTPRGHYTRNADLTRYFVAMSVLGQLGFCLPGTTGCPGLEPARTAILASRALDANPDLVALWRELYEPTAFLVGLADDYTPVEVADAARVAAPGGIEDAAAFADDTVVSAVLDELAQTRSVLISPDRAAIRFMGTRFVLDSYVLDQLLYPNVGSAEKPRTIPSALDVAAAFGSEFAYGALEQLGETAYASYDTQLEALRTAVAARPPEDWGSTVYDAWLYAVEPMFASRAEAYPDLMRSEAWTAKAHQAGLGSYAELKHDTILYTKQAVAEGGDGAPIPPRRNWVEPEPVAFARLAAAADLMQRGLDERGLLTDEQVGLLTDLTELLGFLERIARDELAGEPISELDNERLTHVGEELEAWFWRTSDRLESGETEADQDAAIVADVASGPDGILAVATGRIDRIYVLVPDDAGAFQVAVGGVYSYYEFTSQPGERLTDEAWRATLDAGEAPERPAWQEVLFPG
jgi:hypothetical protein